MANEKNLRPFTSDQSREEAVKNGRKGGKRSGEVRKERKELSDAMATVMSLPCVDDNLKAVMSILGIPEKEQTVRNAIAVAAAIGAQQGDLGKMVFCAELNGESIKHAELKFKYEELKEKKRSNKAKEKIMANANVPTTTASVLSTKIEAMFKQCEGHRGLRLDE